MEVDVALKVDSACEKDAPGHDDAPTTLRAAGLDGLTDRGCGVLLSTRHRAVVGNDAIAIGERRRLDALREVVVGLGFRPYPVAAGMYLLCRCPASVHGRPVADATDAAERLLAESGLAVAPWQSTSRGYLRFSSAYLPEELDGLAELGRGSAIVSD